MYGKKSRISSTSLKTSSSISKPSTITRAAITAEIKLTRDKQLVEHNPFSLIPDPNNPRPGDKIDDAWLIKHLKIGTPASLCYLNNISGDYHIPEFSELTVGISNDLETDYSFLRNLAFSIRRDGLIEPIEIFLADKRNDPEYFINLPQEFGYVVLEGHQRRLAAMMASVSTVTCIELIDETILARLKVKHRKLRRQLSENNLRKNLTVAQNYLIVRELLSTEDEHNLSVKELSSIIGLNEDIAGALKRMCVNKNSLPSAFLELVESNAVSFKWIRTWIGKSNNEIIKEVDRLTKPNEFESINVTKSTVKPRGRNGGATKRSATFKIKNIDDSNKLKNFLLKKIPELHAPLSEEAPFTDLENLLIRLMDIAKEEGSRPGSKLP